MEKNLFNEIYMKVVNDEINSDDIIVAMANEVRKNEIRKNEIRKEIKLKETRGRIW